MKYLALVLLLVAACTPAPQNRVDIKVSNKTNKTVRVRASTLIFAQSVVLRPGESWVGWWDKRFLGKEADFEIEDEPVE